MEIVFRGDIVPGSNIVEVKESLKTRFKLDDAGIARMFSGKPLVIKKGLSEAEAEKFRALMQQLGALVTTRDPAESARPAATATEQTDTSGLTVSDVGNDVLNENERRDFTPAAIDTSSLSLAPDGADVLDEQHKKTFKPADIDTTHLDLEPEN